MTQKSLTFDECKQLSSRIIAMNPNRRANMGQISSHLLDYYTELTKQPWLAQLVGQIRDLTAQQNQMMQEEMKAGETYQQLDRKMSDAYRAVHKMHKDKKLPVRLAAYVVAVSRVAEAVKLRGWV